MTFFFEKYSHKMLMKFSITSYVLYYLWCSLTSRDIHHEMDYVHSIQCDAKELNSISFINFHLFKFVENSLYLFLLIGFQFVKIKAFLEQIWGANDHWHFKKLDCLSRERILSTFTKGSSFRVIFILLFSWRFIHVCRG